jgi:hypothetical protein
VVAFLQAALTMLQAELSSMSGAGLVASGLTAAGENKPGVDPTNSGEVASRADST